MGWKCGIGDIQHFLGPYCLKPKLIMGRDEHKIYFESSRAKFASFDLSSQDGNT